jgi:hypothetical protein
MNRAQAVALLVVKVGFGASLALGLSGVAHAAPVGQLPACEFEDGNVDGLPCIWTSPRTGEQYYNDGSEYR